MYTFNKYGDIYTILGECLGNAAEEGREYFLGYPHRYHPNGQNFEHLL
jgi:hypothetical protein